MEEVVLDGTGEDMLLRWLFGREVSETDGGREGLIVFLWFLQCTRVLCLVHHFLWSSKDPLAIVGGCQAGPAAKNNVAGMGMDQRSWHLASVMCLSMTAFVVL